MNKSTEMCAVHPFKRVCWTAILAGALVGIGLTFLVNLFGMVIGLSIFTVDEASGAAAIAIGGVIGVLVGILVAMFLAGYTSGYLGRHLAPKRNIGILYGFLTWILALLLTGFVMSNLSNHVTNYSSVVAGPRVSLNASTEKKDSSVTIDKAKKSDNETKAVKVMASARDMTIVSFLVFVFFLLGAAAACWGGCAGMSCRHEE